MTKIISEEQIKKYLKEKKIDRKSYQKSFDMDGIILDDIPINELLLKQIVALENILETLNGIEKNTGNKVADETFYRTVGRVMVAIENHLSFAKEEMKKQRNEKAKKWVFRIERHPDKTMKRVVAEEET